MVNIMNLYDQISNELIVNVLYVLRPVIKLVLLVYLIITMIYDLINVYLHIYFYNHHVRFYLFLFYVMVNLSLIKIIFVQNVFAMYYVNCRV
jgi:hypothetical protein